MGRGTLEFLYPENRRVLAFVRRYEDERVLVVANLSRFTQCVELDLSPYQGMTPLELFGSTQFPPVDRPAVFPFAGSARVLLVRAAAEGGREYGLRIRTGEPPTLAGGIVGERLLRRGAR